MKITLLLSTLVFSFFANLSAHADALGVVAVGLSGYEAVPLNFDEIKVYPASDNADSANATGKFSTLLLIKGQMLECTTLISNDPELDAETRHVTLGNCSINGLTAQEGTWVDFYVRISPAMDALLEGLQKADEQSGVRFLK